MSRPSDKSIGTVSVAGSPIKLQMSIKNLGVYLDSTMSFAKQVSQTGKAYFIHIRALCHIQASRPEIVHTYLVSLFSTVTSCRPHSVFH